MSATGPFNCKFIYTACMICCALLIGISASAQKNAPDSTKKIEILSSRLLRHVQTDSGEINKLLDSVVLKQGETMMYCDSAYFNLAKNSMEAFGNVRVIQPGSEGQSDYMRYVGDQKMGYMKGNVMLTDGKSNLWSEEVDYDVANKIGTYTQGGTLQDSATTLSSNSGMYNMKTKDARFTQEVLVTNPDYNIQSEDLGYNTATKVVTFYANSVVTSEKSVLHTSCGTYNSLREIATFPCRSSVINEQHYIEADSLYHNKLTGKGQAKGNVIAIDTENHTTLYCGKADYNEKKRNMLASIKPVLKQMNGKDSLFIRADTLYSAPVPKPGDTVKFTKVTGKGKKKKTEIIYAADTATADSTAPRYFIGYHHVLIFSDSLQGKCDSVSYSDKDSIVRMMYDPIVWTNKSQLTGDTILMYMDSGKIDKTFVPNNGLMISQSGPPKAGLFDQVQGKMITGYFKDNDIHDVLVEPDAEAIYYSKDDNEAYIGVNEASSVRMRIFFKDNQVHHIVFEENVKQKMTPLGKANLPAMKLSRFIWLEDKRPKKLEELFQ